MRPLFAVPPAGGERTHRRFIDRCVLSGMLSDFLAHGQPYPALNAVVLSPADDRRLRALSEAFVSAFHRAAAVVARDVARLQEMGFPWVAAELLAAETPRLPVTGRFDYVQDTAGHWWLLEFNADTPSGIRESTGGEAALCRVVPEAAALQWPNRALPERLRAAFDTALAALDPPGPLGLVTVASEMEDLMQMAFLQRLLRDLPALRGQPVVLGDVDNLRPAGRGVRLSGRPVKVLYRYVPFEAMFGTPPFATMANAVSAGRLALLNGLFGLLLQHKGLMAWLWAHRDDPGFPPEERAAIRGHLPPTWYIGDTPPVEDRATLVAKQVFGREGEEVFLGEALNPAQWGELVRRGTYVAQRRVAVAPVRAGVATGSGATVREGSVTVGAYTAGPSFAGYYSRFGGRIIDSHALWFATLIDPAGGSA